jgi:hypothetical protein
MPLYNPPVIVQQNGTTQGAVNTLNITGSATATVVGNVATINVTGGGSGSVTQIEIDFGTTPTRSKTFVITNAGITTTSKILLTQAGTAATGRQADENEMDPIIFAGIPSTGQFTLIASSLNGPVVGKYRVNYMAG